MLARFFRLRIQDFRFLRVIDLDWKHGYEMIRGNCWCSSMKPKKITSLLTGDKVKGCCNDRVMITESN